MAITIRNEKFFCLNCGGDFAINYPIPVDEMIKKSKAFEDLHKDCKPTWKEPVVEQNKSTQERALWWIANRETGMSSKTMWNCFMGTEKFSINHPYDPDDFKRCYKLLQVIPEWKSSKYMNMLSKLSRQWKNLVENWDKLTEMYEQNERQQWKKYKEIGMYEFMETLMK